VKSIVIVPTYNEKENVNSLLPLLFNENPGLDILVVDDGSPDGTGLAVKALQKEFKGLHLLERSGKSGLGKAYLAGFAWALERGYEFIVEMDADFSHRPIDLKKILEAGKQGADFVIGSRYVSGGATKNWGVGRKIISRGGGFYASSILGFGVSDWTGGFNGWNRRVLTSIGLSDVRSEGYSFQIELKYRARKKGFKTVEVPILFEDRRVGQSKMSFRIFAEALWRVWGIRFGSSS
jgi:dolichol-phosphate mannosyltransferase